MGHQCRREITRPATEEGGHEHSWEQVHAEPSLLTSCYRKAPVSTRLAHGFCMTVAAVGLWLLV